jgi:prepilin-type N-terminal cleavage/methylation domain-containing protein
MSGQLPTVKKIRKNSGLTLIELLVVFTVIAILGGIGIASFVTYSQSQEVTQAAANIKLLINEAKFNALNVVKTASDGKGQDFSCGSEVLGGYLVEIVQPRTIRLAQVCEITTNTIKTITLSNTSSFTTPPATTCGQIMFASLSSTGSGLPCNISINGLGGTKLISIDEIGNINVE